MIFIENMWLKDGFTLTIISCKWWIIWQSLSSFCGKILDNDMFHCFDHFEYKYVKRFTIDLYELFGNHPIHLLLML